MIRLLHLSARDSDPLRHSIRQRMSDLPPALRCSLTGDQSKEMARHLFHDVFDDDGTGEEEGAVS